MSDRCSDCGWPIEAWGRRVRCLKCKILGDLNYIGTDKKAKAKCNQCHNEYIRMNNNNKVTCGNPECTPKLLMGPKGTCRRCKREDVPVIGEGLPVCTVCGTDFDYRPSLISALTKGQASRIKNPPPEPVEEEVDIDPVI